MPLPDDYLKYPHRGHNMDHDRYAWSDMYARKPLQWPNGAKVALWVTPLLQWFPLDGTGKPFRAPGSLTMPFPDFRHYTLRDYGNRIGIFRILDVLDDLKIPASAAVNAVIAERHPSLIQELVSRNIEIIAHGLDMDTVHHSGLTAEAEGAIVAKTLKILRQASGQPVTGWLSPGRAQSFATPDILAAHGVTYACDWANDDLPYAMQTTSGSFYAMPYAQETDDRTVMLDFHHTEDDWLAQVKDRFDVMYRESERYGGRVVSIPLHAWVSGVAYRIGKVREALEYMMGHDGVWAATGADILESFRAQEAGPRG